MKTVSKNKNPIKTVSFLFQGLKLISHKGVRKFLIIPILINLVLYSLAFMIGYHYLDVLIDHFIPNWLSWLRWLLWPLFFLSFSIVCFFTFTVLANLLASPFYGMLASKVLSIKSGSKSEINEPPVAKIVIGEIGRIWYLITRAIPLLILSLIPGINVVSPFLWALFGAWGCALEYMAYPMENKGLVFKQQRIVLKSDRVNSLSFGSVVMLGLTIPILNLVIAPAAVIGATLYIHSEKK